MKKKLRKISEFVTSQTGQQTIAKHMLMSEIIFSIILTKISRSKGNKAMEFGQL